MRFNFIVTDPATVSIEKEATKSNHVVKMFLCDSLNSSCNAQYFHTTEHTYARLTFVVSLVDNEFLSKYC